MKECDDVCIVLSTIVRTSHSQQRVEVHSINNKLAVNVRVLGILIDDYGLRALHQFIGMRYTALQTTCPIN